MPTVLIIDDEPALVEDVCTILELEGFDTVRAENGQVGLAHLQNNVHVDIILCDISMPLMNGYEVLAAVRANPDLDSTPFVFLSALKPTEVKRIPGQRTEDAYIAKPFNLDDLIGTINRLLDSKG